jgi:hypothetical protein
MKLPLDSFILLCQGLPPFIGKKNVYYEDGVFKSRMTGKPAFSTREEARAMAADTIKKIEARRWYIFKSKLDAEIDEMKVEIPEISEDMWALFEDMIDDDAPDSAPQSAPPSDSVSETDTSTAHDSVSENDTQTAPENAESVSEPDTQSVPAGIPESAGTAAETPSTPAEMAETYEEAEENYL